MNFQNLIVPRPHKGTRNKDPIAAYIIQKDASIIQALKQLDRIEFKTLLVTENNMLVGTLSDGDIRRYILKGKSLEATIETIYNTSPTYILEDNYNKELAHNTLLDMHKLAIIPIVKPNKKIVRIITWKDIVQDTHPKNVSVPLKIPVVIIAGGKGDRLKPFTNILPKPLIPIGDKTILEAILQHFKNKGAAQQYIILNYKAGMIEAYLENLIEHYNINFIREKAFSGTAGSLNLLKTKFKSPFILSNCDILVKADYTEAIERHQSEQAYLTIFSAIKHFRIPYGVVKFETGGLVSQIKEKPEYTITINTGVYILDNRCLEFIPDHGIFNMPDLINILLNKQKKILTYPVNENDYTDVGQWDEYKKALKHFSDNNMPVFPSG
jgi:dTDP-glucose pyrophosphorylase